MVVQLTILGSGTSHGVPMIGCDCRVCTSDDPRDRRLRSSAVFTVDGRNILIDTGPELRIQCLRNGIRTVDALLYTHHHADHIVGLDDVRSFNRTLRGRLPVYASPETFAVLREMFAYAFVDDPEYPSAKPHLDPREIDGPFELFDQRVIPVPVLHGPLPVFGFRIGRLAYIPDVNHVPDASRELLAGLDVLVLDCLRLSPHPTHFNLDQAVAEARRIGARATWFTDIAHEILHADVAADLPEGMALAYDGLVLEAGD